MSLIPKRGRPSSPLIMEVEGELTLDDLLQLRLAPPPPLAAPATQRLRTIHHRIAIAQAGGLPLSEIALRYDLTSARINQLQRDPAYCEILAYYSDQVIEQNLDAATRFQEKLLDVAELSLDSIQEQLEEDPRKVPISERRQLVAMGADRTVAPPKTAPAAVPANMTVTFNMGTRDIRPKEEPGQIIEHEEKIP